MCMKLSLGASCCATTAYCRGNRQPATNIPSRCIRAHSGSGNPLRCPSGVCSSEQTKFIGKSHKNRHLCCWQKAYPSGRKKMPSIRLGMGRQEAVGSASPKARISLSCAPFLHRTCHSLWGFVRTILRPVDET